MQKFLLILTVSALAFFGLEMASASSPSDNDVITKHGTETAPTGVGKTQNNSSGTLFLRRTVEPSPKPSTKSTLKPQATRASPVSKPKPIKLAPKTAADSKSPSIKIQKKTSPSPSNDDLDEYSHIANIADPAEPLNRGTFWLNQQLYNYLLRPFSKAYEFILPSPARKVIHNVFDNVEYPVRVVNHVLQFELKRADLETRKFVVNSVAGVGGILRVSDRIPELANIPPADTGQTFAKWGIGHGAYIILPLIGPRSVRDTVGMAGDYALNPVSWISYGVLTGATGLAISGPSTARNMNNRINLYDAATQNAIDPYIAVRTGYVQYREQAVSK
jgi:phospholipid-binding lipoprotein MlaA